MSLLTGRPRKPKRADSVRTAYLGAGMVLGCAVTLVIFWVLR